MQESSLTEARHPRKAGEDSRQVIKAALRRRLASGQRAPTLAELAEETALSKTNVDHHLRWMVREGVIRIEDARREIILLEDVDISTPSSEAAS